jgi:chemotaxis protein CheC
VSILNDERDTISLPKLDVLREVANIGAASAANSLAVMLKSKIDISVPQAQLMPFADVPAFMGGAEAHAVAIYFHVGGTVQASMMLVMSVEKAAQLVEMLLGTSSDVNLSGSFSNMEFSALMELGNILSSSYLNALSQFTKLAFKPSLPALAIDMVGAVLNTILAQHGEVSDMVLVMETGFKRDKKDVVGNIFLLPEPGTLDVIFTSLGVTV